MRDTPDHSHPSPQQGTPAPYCPSAPARHSAVHRYPWGACSVGGWSGQNSCRTPFESSSRWGDSGGARFVPWNRHEQWHVSQGQPAGPCTHEDQTHPCIQACRNRVTTASLMAILLSARALPGRSKREVAVGIWPRDGATGATVNATVTTAANVTGLHHCHCDCHCQGTFD